ncbi:I78 family peptidase inhibitor [Pelagibacterium luteolum]|uniref:Peptidase inhibitor I78 family protein n=1 Tax=Pelagibacterium luteolum TaxID=440168 RepID=A0A1G7W0D3_9HYPH|nr:I78 family peptidase inhibitor [Pelagibacterium luteolum]SDG65482.1 Peptidase inhibitor I78 family protein [Pelagibacterium luteolum]
MFISKKSALVSFALVGTLALGACSSTPPTPPSNSMPPPVDCGASGLSSRTGQPVTGSTAQDVRVGGEEVRSQGSVRVIGPGDMVTQDFREDRLNLEVSATGSLVRAYCG